MIHNEYEQIAFYGEPSTYRKNGKYLIEMVNNQFKETSRFHRQYRKYKCSDGWTNKPDECWQFTKQGAMKKIEALKREYHINYDKGLIEFNLVEAWDEL